MKKIFSFMGLLALLTTLFTVVPQDAHANTYNATIDYVVDGDTVYLNEEILGTKKVRLLSIDAPETNYYGESQDPWGPNATEYLEQLLPPGTPVTIETDTEELDAYGRLLAHVWKGDLDVNEDMLRQGHAVTYYIWPNMKYFEEYRSAMLEAKEAGRNIWDPDHPMTELPFEFRDRVSGDEQDKYVGDYYTKEYVQPADYKQVPMENRVFFFTEQDAQDAGYTPADDGSTTPSGLVINEVLPAHQNYAHEFIEIYNGSDRTVDLSGYVIDDIVGGGSSPYTIPDGTSLAPGEYYVWTTEYYFNNDGDDVTLSDPNGNMVDQYTYSSTDYDMSWHRSPDGGSWSSIQASPTEGTANP
ncbi:endonuclease YncB(thermonuclease family) [Melghirimyces profundicolus]|uniref:Endonuclease YncB(Thermonuclease family) n=1 Tax=Melghirimyces profundicolus TaxID=1242148 RepID=A0A2T6C7T6_9BACL|nr:lamin tail domain-containing protein [Melghirimyces profundicolus]PTX64389.1 endonuclease YncB(thermonuclease family) [Melghirimyces profundicolus]